MPDIAYNLFSIGAALDKGLVYHAEKNACIITKDNQTVIIGMRKDRLYKLLIRVRMSKTPLALMARASTSKMWCKRLRHQNKLYLKPSGMSAIGSEKELCPSCVYDKHHRQSSGQRFKKASTVGELIHSDVCGSMQEVSIGGARYFCTFKDDFSYYKRVCFYSEIKMKLKTS